MIRIVIPYPRVLRFAFACQLDDFIPAHYPTTAARTFIVPQLMVIIAQFMPVRFAVTAMIPAMVMQDDIMMVPVAETEIETGGNPETCSPVESEMVVMITRIIPVERGIIVPPPVSIDVPCIVIRHINHFHFLRLNNDDLILLADYQVLHGIKVASIKGFPPQHLDGFHDLFFLEQECIAQLAGPGKLLIHELYQVGECHQGLHTDVPIHCLGCVDCCFSFKLGLL